MQFAKGSSLDVSGYKSISMYIYVTSNWSAGDSVAIYGWDTGTSLQIGNSVLLQNYFSWSIYGIWHKILIPITDMGLSASSIDALRIRIISKQAIAPLFYIDDFAFEETGEPIRYYIKPDTGTWLHVEELTFSVADAYTGISTVAGATENATLMNIAYNKILGVTPTIGILYQRKISGIITTVPNIIGILDILQLPGTRISGSGGDGTNSWVTTITKFTEPVILKSKEDDEMSFTISDDFSGLLRMRISAGCGEEIRQQYI